MRKGQIEDVQKVALALWEPDGTISFFKDTKYHALTPEDMKLTINAFDLPKTIIKEGKFDFEELSDAGKDEEWVKRQIQSTYNLDVKQILLATIDKQEKINVFLYK